MYSQSTRWQRGLSKSSEINVQRTFTFSENHKFYARSTSNAFVHAAYVVHIGLCNFASLCSTTRFKTKKKHSKVILKHCMVSTLVWCVFVIATTVLYTSQVLYWALTVIRKRNGARVLVCANSWKIWHWIQNQCDISKEVESVEFLVVWDFECVRHLCQLGGQYDAIPAPVWSHRECDAPPTPVWSHNGVNNVVENERRPRWRRGLPLVKKCVLVVWQKKTFIDDLDPPPDLLFSTCHLVSASH